MRRTWSPNIADSNGWLQDQDAMTYGRLYLVRNRINRKVYRVQTTRTIKHRFQEHLAEAARGSKDCPHLYEAFRKYGPGAFEVSQISEANSEEELTDLKESG